MEKQSTSQQATLEARHAVRRPIGNLPSHLPLDLAPNLT
jgi:hypothetical protein